MLNNPEAHSEIQHLEDGRVYSARFDDIYFSSSDAPDESECVFFDAANIQTLKQSAPAKPLVIGETGFGTGINFWLTLAKWQQSSKPLHFVSLEKYPLDSETISKVLSHWPQLLKVATPFLKQWSHTSSKLKIQINNICLEIFYEEALAALSQFPMVDAWFLDGFAPEKNPEMWNPQVFASLAKASNPQATLATFTSAGFVRRGLEEVGFVLEKVPGWQGKYHRLKGFYSPKASRSTSEILDERQCSLYNALCRPDLNKIQSLLQEGANPEIPYGKKKQNALDFCLEHQQIANAQYLLEQFPQLCNQTNYLGLSPLCTAIKQKIDFMIEPLITSKTINYADNQGRTPLLIALKQRNFKAAFKLLNAGADINLRDNQGLSPRKFVNYQKKDTIPLEILHFF